MKYGLGKEGWACVAVVAGLGAMSGFATAPLITWPIWAVVMLLTAYAMVRGTKWFNIMFKKKVP